MKDIYLVNYSVKGIKTIDQLVSLSFYKKTITKYPDTKEYNVKGIYGMNGSGKTGIVASVDILKSLLINSGYLNNPIVQKQLDALIHKQSKELFIEVDFLAGVQYPLFFYRYQVTLSKDHTGKYVIAHEKLSSKMTSSKGDELETIFEVVDGVLVNIPLKVDHEFINMLINKTLNLLSSSSMSALFTEKILPAIPRNNSPIQDSSFVGLCTLFVLGTKFHIYLEQPDDHKEYILRNSFGVFEAFNKAGSEFDDLIDKLVEMDSDVLNILSTHRNIVPKRLYDHFENTISKLYEFLHIFKSDLKAIEVEKKEDYDAYICNLIMVYDDYKIHAEFESTGIKKLIKLFAYLTEMVQGGIIFIDEFDSNLHDVYLCALLEYLMEYGEGQLCFTTHNVGPMDILRRNKKSIDFLSVDHKIYPWKTNGNYSPSKLYRNGMIEGSPFNVDSIDFIKAFHIEEDD